MTEAFSAPFDYEPVHFDAIIEYDKAFEVFRTRVRAIEEMLAAGEITAGDDRFEQVTRELSMTFPYFGEAVSLLAKIRVEDDGDEEVARDVDGQYTFPDEAVTLRAMGAEIIPEPSEEDEGKLRVQYLFASPIDAMGRTYYYCHDEDIYQTQFETLHPDSLRWQLERLVPEVVGEIDARLPEGISLSEGLQRLGGLTLQLDTTMFGEYKVVRHLANYINQRLPLDTRVLHNLTLHGEVTVTTTDDDKDEVAIVIELNEPFHTPGYLAPIQLGEYYAADGSVSYVPRATVYTYREARDDDEDDELTMSPEVIVGATSLRPALSIGRALLAHLELPQAQISQADAIAAHIEVESSGEEGSETFHERMRYLQMLVDAAGRLARPISEMKFVTVADAKQAAEQLAAAIDSLFEGEWETLLEIPFVAEGLGVRTANYETDGNLVDAAGTRTSVLMFQQDSEMPLIGNELMQTYDVTLNGSIFPYAIHHEDEEDDWYEVQIDLGVTVLSDKKIYRQEIPGEDRVARDYAVTEYAYVRLDGSATLTQLDLYDIDRFEQSMEIFARRLETMPDLKKSYKALRSIHTELLAERTASGFTKLRHAKALRRLGLAGGGDQEAASLIVDTLSDLLGHNRVVSVAGAVYEEGSDDFEPQQRSFVGTIADVISIRPGSSLEEPMLVLTPMGGGKDKYVYVPLQSILELYF